MEINTILIRSRTEPHLWSLLFEIGGKYYEADLSPGTVRELQSKFIVETWQQQEPGGAETYELIALTEKTT